MRIKSLGALALFFLAVLASVAWLTVHPPSAATVASLAPLSPTALLSPDTAVTLGAMLLVGNTIDALQDTVSLTQTINSLIEMRNGLHKVFASTVQMHDTEMVAFDVKSKRRVRARYVHPRSPGKPRNLTGFRTDSFKPAYIKELTVFDPSRPLKRMAGEGLMGTMSPQERIEAAMMETLMEHREAIDRELEYQTLTAMRDGKIIIDGEDYPAVEIDFGRSDDNNVAANTLVGAARWSQKDTADPLKTFRQLSRVTVKGTGSAVAAFIMDSAAYDAFRSIPRIDDVFDTANINVGQLNFDEAQTEGVIWRGRADGFLVGTYDAWFENRETNEDEEALGEGMVIGVGAAELTTHFGAIQDFEANFAPMPIFTKAWPEKNPSGLHILSQSAPLVALQRPDATVVAQVITGGAG